MFPLIPPRPFLPAITVSHSCKGLSSSILQTISDYKLPSTSARRAGVQDHVRGKPYTARTLSLTTEVLLKSRDIIESFGYSEKGQVHTPGQQEGASR